MARYDYTFSGDVDLWTNPAITLHGSAPATGAEIVAAAWHAKVRAHADADVGASTSITIRNGSTQLYSDTVEASSITADPDWPEWRRIVTFDGTLVSSSVSLTDFFQGKTSLTLENMQHDEASIPGAIAELLELTVTAITSEGWVAMFWDGSQWRKTIVQQYTGAGWQKCQLRYWNGQEFI